MKIICVNACWSMGGCVCVHAGVRHFGENAMKNLFHHYSINYHLWSYFLLNI